MKKIFPSVDCCPSPILEEWLKKSYLHSYIPLLIREAGHDVKVRNSNPTCGIRMHREGSRIACLNQFSNQEAKWACVIIKIGHPHHPEAPNALLSPIG